MKLNQTQLKLIEDAQSAMNDAAQKLESLRSEMEGEIEAKSERWKNIDEVRDILMEQFDVRSYSGRGMNGRQCVGIVGELGQIMAGILDSCEGMDDTSGVQDALRSMKIDSMGLDTIFYFPRVPWPFKNVENKEAASG